MGYYPPFVIPLSGGQMISPLAQPKVDKVSAVHRVPMRPLSPFSDSFFSKLQKDDQHPFSQNRLRRDHPLLADEEKGKYIDWLI